MVVFIGTIYKTKHGISGCLTYITGDMGLLQEAFAGGSYIFIFPDI
jgi:hypothetical protein